MLFQLLLTPALFVVLLAVRHLLTLYVRSPAGGWIRRWNSNIGESQAAAHRARLADRLARGEDRYFEELREIQAYAPQPAVENAPFPDYSWRTLLCAGSSALLLTPALARLLHFNGGHF